MCDWLLPLLLPLVVTEINALLSFLKKRRHVSSCLPCLPLPRLPPLSSNSSLLIKRKVYQEYTSNRQGCLFLVTDCLEHQREILGTERGRCQSLLANDWQDFFPADRQNRWDSISLEDLLVLDFNAAHFYASRASSKVNEGDIRDSTGLLSFWIFQLRLWFLCLSRFIHASRTSFHPLDKKFSSKEFTPSIDSHLSFFFFILSEKLKDKEEGERTQIWQRVLVLKMNLVKQETRKGTTRDSFWGKEKNDMMGVKRDAWVTRWEWECGGWQRLGLFHRVIVS